MNMTMDTGSGRRWDWQAVTHAFNRSNVPQREGGTDDTSHTTVVNLTAKDTLWTVTQSNISSGKLLTSLTWNPTSTYSVGIPLTHFV